MVEVIVASDLIRGERRVELSWTLEELAKRLEQITGIPPDSQDFDFISETGQKIQKSEANSTLESVGVKDGWEIFVNDTRPVGSRLDLDSDSEETYVMSQEDYEKRQNTILQWKKENKLGRFADQQSNCRVKTPSSEHVFTLDEVSVALHSECFVRLMSGKTVRGRVEYIGEVPAIGPGIWVGVRLVSAEGKNNGTVKGIHLFDAEPNHGTLVRPNAVRPLDDDEIEL